jgi:hypothetical protein
MEYLLIDAHQRFLGMMQSDRELSVGDTFQAENRQTYAVVSLNSSNQRLVTGLQPSGLRRQALTVVAVQRGFQQPTPVAAPA